MPHASPTGGKRLTVSLCIFVLSALVFTHQCVTPLSATSLRAVVTTLRSPSRRTGIPVTIASSSTSDTPRMHARTTGEIQRRHDHDNRNATDAMNTHTASRARHANKPVAAPGNTERTRTVDAAATPHTTNNTRAETTASTTGGTISILSSVPSGPYPLPDLLRRRGHAAKQTAQSRETKAVQAGMSWTASLSRGIEHALPLHWLSEARRTASALADSLPRADAVSIFRARRKGDWIGCKRPHHLVCKGVYRAIKHTNALSLLDLDCIRNANWLPYILRKLQEELRPIRLYCGVSATTTATTATTTGDNNTSTTRTEIGRLYTDVGLEDIVQTDVGTISGGLLPDGLDALVAYRAVAHGTLIDAMRLFKGVKNSRAVTYLIVETYPDVDNMAARSRTHGLRINVGAAPFWFPAPVFEYGNAEENDEDIDMEVVAVRTDELFEERVTPEMKDLVDPRKRSVLE